jgi:3-hydroxybutyryl-CoA dehydratase
MTLAERFPVGAHADITKTVTEADVAAFADITGDRNPVHLDEDYARGTRFGGRIAHGILTAGLISAVLGMKLPGTGGIYRSQELKFVKPVHLGDAITARAEVIEVDAEKSVLTLKTECLNQRGELVLTGVARIWMPAHPAPAAS